MQKTLLSGLLMLALQAPAQCWQAFEPGYNHSTAINTDGRIRNIGYNAYGQIGDGTNTERHVFTLAGTAQYTAVSGGGNFTLALRADGTLWSWGRNVQGELGPGITGNKNNPTQVGTATDWTRIWAGSFNSFAQKSDGSLWSWGLNYYGQLGHTGSAMAQIGTDTDWLEVAHAPNSTLLLKTDHTLWSLSSSGATQVGTDNDWAMVKGGDAHFIGLKQDGSVWTWGSNSQGQLGNPNPNPDGSMMRRVGTGNDWSVVSAGQDYCIALKTDGTMWAWGNGAYGALGFGNVQDFDTPQMVGTATDWVMVKSHGAHNMALKANGQLYSWGENTYGQLGVIYPNGNTPSVSPCPALLQVESFGQPVLTLFPNPVTDMLQIGGLPEPETTAFRIYDQLGRMIRQGKISGGRIGVDGLAQGLYLLEIQGEVRVVLQFVKR